MSGESGSAPTENADSTQAENEGERMSPEMLPGHWTDKVWQVTDELIDKASK